MRSRWTRLFIQCFSHFDFSSNRIDQNFRWRTARIRFAFDDDDLPDAQLLAIFFPGAREQHQLNVALNILDGDEAHGLVGLGHIWAHVGDQPRNTNLFLVLRFVQLSREMRDDLCQRGLIRRERMIGNVKTDEFTFPIELFALIHVIDIGQCNGFRDTGHRAE